LLISLQDLRLLGQLKFGIYQDSVDNIGHCNGLGNDDPNNLAPQIQEELRSQIRHEAVRVPDHRNPFLDERLETEFFTALQELVEEEVIPVGYGLHKDEWEGDAYPTFETLHVGKRRGGKSTVISLEDPIWQCRTVLWVQGVHLLSMYLELMVP
jgi:predicted DNA-binding ribbon-helix-helix protein